MSVYVDNYRAQFGRMVMCHMVADTRAELHESSPHYDVSLSKRDQAIKLGAILVDRRGLVEVVRRARAAGWP